MTTFRLSVIEVRQTLVEVRANSEPEAKANWEGGILISQKRISEDVVDSQRIKE